MNTVLVGNTLSEKCRTVLENMGYSVILLPPFAKLGEGVNTHADMLLFYDGQKLILHKDYYNENKALFNALNVELLLSDEAIGNKYPDDVRFNAVLTNDGVLFAKTGAVSQHIESMAKKTVWVKQGYTACSTCRVADKGFITSDAGLYKAYTDNGIDALKVSTNNISIPGFNCGFIGGASLVVSDSVCFFGDIGGHPDYNAIVDFASKYGKKVHSLSDEKLTDIGGGVVIK